MLIQKGLKRLGINGYRKRQVRSGCIKSGHGLGS